MADAVDPPLVRTRRARGRGCQRGRALRSCVGGLDRAAYLEATTAFLIGLWRSGHDPRTLLPPFEAATA